MRAAEISVIVGLALQGCFWFVLTAALCTVISVLLILTR
jgi:hypothetical protein